MTFKNFFSNQTEDGAKKKKKIFMDMINKSCRIKKLNISF